MLVAMFGITNEGLNLFVNLLVLFLVVAGLEVNLGIVKRRGRTAMAVSLLGILVPLGAVVACRC